jgi:hypothetical protein
LIDLLNYHDWQAAGASLPDVFPADGRRNRPGNRIVANLLPFCYKVFIKLQQSVFSLSAVTQHPLQGGTPN